jgi:cell fate regulator YaaT (PSP1 superfamily)
MRIEQREMETPLRKVLRKCTKKNMDAIVRLEQLEQEAMDFCQGKIKEKSLPMDLLDVEFTFDESKATFYFKANKRIDFRELVKELAQQFKTRIEMRQIGARDEAKLWGGLGVCGRGCCCTTFLQQFQPVSINMAKQQKLTLDPAKISGQCGRLMCCLAFELGAWNKQKQK